MSDSEHDSTSPVGDFILPGEQEAWNQRCVGYHVTFRSKAGSRPKAEILEQLDLRRRTHIVDQDVVGRPTFVIVLFGIHPLIWAAGREDKYETDWREFDDYEGEIYKAVTGQKGFSWAEAKGVEDFLPDLQIQKWPVKEEGGGS